MGSSNHLGDRVKTDERNGYQMREREQSARVLNRRLHCFVGSSNCLGDGVKTDERNGYQMREGEERTVN